MYHHLLVAVVNFIKTITKKKKKYHHEYLKDKNGLSLHQSQTMTAKKPYLMNNAINYVGNQKVFRPLSITDYDSRDDDWAVITNNLSVSNYYLQVTI